MLIDIVSHLPSEFSGRTKNFWKRNMNERARLFKTYFPCELFKHNLSMSMGQEKKLPAVKISSQSIF